MPISLISSSKKEYSACIVTACPVPLGYDSREIGWRTCTAHRKCSICGHDLKPLDVQLAHDAVLADLADSPTASKTLDPLDLIHTRCAIAQGRLGTLESDPTLSLKQSTFNLLNSARLMVDPDMNLSLRTNENNAMIRSAEFCDELLLTSNALNVDQMNFDAIYVHQKMLEACLAAVSILVSKQDRTAIKARADAREAIAYKSAKQDAKTSSRPVSKLATDNSEVELAKFMEIFSIKERKTALEIKRGRDKAIESLVKIGIPLELAIAQCNADILKRRSPEVQL